ncbi:MAG: chemotaxis response regulator protein-glutamate methylesterase [Anaerolineae bacterium]|nr:chemotaxis response regulator protein-glutamate methylesterase [Anaerolineae bacterium]
MKTPVRVLVVDDSAFMRLAISKRLETDPEIVVVGTARDGLDALRQIKALKPDVVTLDVEMPGMDGLSALRRVMAECPTRVIMLSALTSEGAQATITALMRGAVDFVAKPSSAVHIHSVIAELSHKIKLAAAAPATLPPVAPPAERATTVPKAAPTPYLAGDPLIIIGASTGGPAALHRVLSGLPNDLPAAILIVQHMPAGFTGALARRLDEQVALTVREARAGDALARGLALVAPGDFHLVLDRERITLERWPRQNGVRPSVDITMESAARQYGKAVIGVVLTGMGTDGTAGARIIKQYGGRIIAQDQTTCVVYGMPRSVIEAGLADMVIPLSEIPAALMEIGDWRSGTRK